LGVDPIQASAKREAGVADAWESTPFRRARSAKPVWLTTRR
jgi:hypothetical protein